MYNKYTHACKYNIHILTAQTMTFSWLSNSKANRDQTAAVVEIIVANQQHGNNLLSVYLPAS